MEWCIPIQTFQVTNVQMGSIYNPMKPLVPLAYKDADLHFPALSFLLPALPIKYYDATSGRLVLSLAESTQTLNKLQTLQDMLLSAVNTHHVRWNIGSTVVPRRPQDIRAGFQPMVMNSELHLYCPTHEGMTQPISMYQGGNWQKGKVKSGSLRPGKHLRIALRIHGISFHILPGSAVWTGKFRLQHKIIGVLVESD